MRQALIATTACLLLGCQQPIQYDLRATQEPDAQHAVWEPCGGEPIGDRLLRLIDSGETRYGAAYREDRFWAIKPGDSATDVTEAIGKPLQIRRVTGETEQSGAKTEQSGAKTEQSGAKTEQSGAKTERMHELWDYALSARPGARSSIRVVVINGESRVITRCGYFKKDDR